MSPSLFLEQSQRTRLQHFALHTGAGEVRSRAEESTGAHHAPAQAAGRPERCYRQSRQWTIGSVQLCSWLQVITFMIMLDETAESGVDLMIAWICTGHRELLLVQYTKFASRVTDTERVSHAHDQ